MRALLDHAVHAPDVSGGQELGLRAASSVERGREGHVLLSPSAHPELQDLLFHALIALLRAVRQLHKAVEEGGRLLAQRPEEVFATEDVHARARQHGGAGLRPAGAAQCVHGLAQRV